MSDVTQEVAWALVFMPAIDPGRCVCVDRKRPYKSGSC